MRARTADGGGRSDVDDVDDGGRHALLESSGATGVVAHGGNFSAWRFYTEVTPPLLLSGFLSLIPGAFITANQALFRQVPGLLLLTPALIGMRGNIFGSLSARLSTELQVKKHHSRGFARRVRFFDAFSMFEVLTLSLVLPLVARVAVRHLPAALVPGGGDAATAAPLDVIVFVCAVSGLLTGALMLRSLKATIVLAVQRGLNPDNVAPPFVTTLGDLLTLPVILAVTRVALSVPRWARVASVGALVVVGVRAARTARRAGGARFVVATARERLPVLFACMLVSFVAGLALERLLDAASDGATHDDTLLAYLGLVPLMNAQGGAGGSVMASRTSTRHGVDAKTYAPPPPVVVASTTTTRGVVAAARVDAALADAAASSPTTLAVTESLVLTAAMTTVLCVVGSFLCLVSTPLRDDALGLATVMVLMSTLLGGASAFIATLTMHVAVWRQWEPDNVAVPVVCACMDLVASWGLAAVVATVARPANE